MIPSEKQFTLPLTYPVFETSTSAPLQCRCGTLVEEGGTLFGITVVAWSLQSHFVGGLFCSRKCVRTFLVESLAVMDEFDSPASLEMIPDLHELHGAVAATLAELPAA
jgi:hypothetical protein